MPTSGLQNQELEILTAEKSYEDEYVRVSYEEKNGLDEKVSGIRIDAL